MDVDHDGGRLTLRLDVPARVRALATTATLCRIVRRLTANVLRTRDGRSDVRVAWAGVRDMGLVNCRMIADDAMTKVS
jgi:hypothetical protein